MKDNHQWGHCEHCKYFASPALVPVGSEEAKCMHRALSKFNLLVFGASGCSAFELRPGLPESVERPEQIPAEQRESSAKSRKASATR